MTQDKLATELEAFHQCLVEAPSIDAATREKLKTLIGEIQTALASPRPADALQLEAKVPEEETFQQRVDKLIHDFEVQHPQLTTNLAIIAERLADMGI
ncbi:MAG: DUF4404 family protein [Pirellula sp.]